MASSVVLRLSVIQWRLLVQYAPQQRRAHQSVRADDDAEMIGIAGPNVTPLLTHINAVYVDPAL